MDKSNFLWTIQCMIFGLSRSTEISCKIVTFSRGRYLPAAGNWLVTIHDSWSRCCVVYQPIYQFCRLPCASLGFRVAKRLNNCALVRNLRERLLLVCKYSLLWLLELFARAPRLVCNLRFAGRVVTPSNHGRRFFLDSFLTVFLNIFCFFLFFSLSLSA